MMRFQKILINSRSAKLKAVRRVTQDNLGKKTAGIDGVKFLSPVERWNLAKTIRIDGKASSIRQAFIPKNNKETRHLRILTIEDIAKQFLAFIALELLWEASFEPNSYSFRPDRSCHNAIEAIFIAINKKSKYVLDIDIQGCFNEINHNALLAKLNTFSKMKKQIEVWLKAGILENNVIHFTEKSTPQGSLISSLFMNISPPGDKTRCY